MTTKYIRTSQTNTTEKQHQEITSWNKKHFVRKALKKKVSNYIYLANSIKNRDNHLLTLLSSILSEEAKQGSLIAMKKNDLKCKKHELLGSKDKQPCTEFHYQSHYFCIKYRTFRLMEFGRFTCRSRLGSLWLDVLS